MGFLISALEDRIELYGCEPEVSYIALVLFRERKASSQENEIMIIVLLHNILTFDLVGFCFLDSGQRHAFVDVCLSA